MSSDYASPQGGSSSDSNSPSDASAQAFAEHNPALARNNKLLLRPELVRKPDLFTLYFGFWGQSNWTRELGSMITSRVENQYVLTARYPTQEEMDAHLEHGSRTLYYRRIGVPLSSFAGAAYFYNKARKSPDFPKNPTPKSLFDTARKMWSFDINDFKRTTASTAFKMLFIVTAAAMASSGWAVSSDAMSTLGDPRMKQFVEDMRKSNPEDVRKRKIQAANERVRSVRQGAADIGTQMRQQNGQGGFSENGGYSQDSYDSPAAPAPPSDSDSYNNTPTSSQSSYESQTQPEQRINTGAVWARGRNSQPESKSALDFMDEDDASPTAAEYRNTNIDGSPSGSAWDRIRRQNAGGRSLRQPPGMTNPYAEYSDHNQEQYGSGQLSEKDRAQADFDRMIDAERNVGSGGSSRSRGW
ncbi:hypothetical protein PENANT_c007G06270 [Penicillium antarcticum]|uniref:Uncharacterized protein n=1 Tax=Penicillium antarcticum TaxID=416450 RepID=A0A1V6QCC5_9EURO|nr:uncharacterized protein N7508_003462 [Penicillium antarcticum]KAJ5312632.1 hypothetical protein N7508_003462 [Penicillium antarcticum]OQD86516.1 hypothetical protein PENANT_c007G06270 [Penicillium antarcticum]